MPPPPPLGCSTDTLECWNTLKQQCDHTRSGAHTQIMPQLCRTRTPAAPFMRGLGESKSLVVLKSIVMSAEFATLGSPGCPKDPRQNQLVWRSNASVVAILAFSVSILLKRSLGRRQPATSLCLGVAGMRGQWSVTMSWVNPGYPSPAPSRHKHKKKHCQAGP